MARFKRPTGSIEDYNDLRIGDHIYEVFGIWPPQMGREYIVTRLPTLMRDHPEGKHSIQQDEVVFDVQRVNSKYKNGVLQFAADGNMVPGGHSHNDNYWFRSENAAVKAVAFLRDQWERNPTLIKREFAEDE